MSTPHLNEVPVPVLPLNDGGSIPAIGLGTYGLNGAEGTAAVVAAIESGYRLLDTALNYGNEDAVGAAVRSAGVPRDELLVTTKLPGRHHGYEAALSSFEESRANLGLDYVDLYLIHWPNPSVDRYVDAFRAFVKLREDGLVRHVGVSNFTPEFLLRLRDETGVVPAVNQVELHPYFGQAELRAVHAELGIVTESWSPLARKSELLAEPALAELAARHGVTATQIVLRWHVQHGAVPIPKSADPQRQAQNLDVFGFTLTDADMALLDAFERGRIWGADPLTHEEM